MRGYETCPPQMAIIEKVLRIPMRGYETLLQAAAASDALVTNPHEGL